MLEYFFTLDGADFILAVFKMITSIFCGGIIGIERGRSNQAAGMRTYMLVCLGSTVVMMTGQFLHEEYATGDPARLGAQVISGIGFFGAQVCIYMEINLASEVDDISQSITESGLVITSIRMNEVRKRTHKLIFQIKNGNRYSHDELLCIVRNIDGVKYAEYVA